MALARFGDGAYADLKGGATPARALVWRATEGWEAEVFDYNGHPPKGRHRVWGPELHQSEDIARQAAESAARCYSQDKSTVLQWIGFPSISVPQFLQSYLSRENTLGK